MEDDRLPENEQQRNIGLSEGNYSENVGNDVYNIRELNIISKNDSKSNQNTIRRNPKIPKLLPYLPDRQPQETKLEQILQNCLHLKNHKPLVCILHGDKSQGHDTFLERTREEFLPKRFKPHERCPIKKYAIRFPKNIDNKDNFHQQLQNTLATEITNYSFDSIQEINNCISNAPTMIYVTLSVEEWHKLEVKFIEFFLEFWQKWTDMCSSQFLMVCLSIKYPTEDNLSFCKKYRLRKMKGKFIEQLEQCFNKRLNQITGIILPELKGVKQEHVNDWLSIEVKKRFQNVEDLDNQIESLYTNWSKQNKSKEIPMNYLAEKLRKLLQKNLLGEEDIR